MPERDTKSDAASVLSRVACWIMLPLLVAACGDAPPDSGSGTVVITGTEQAAVPAADAGAAPGQQAGPGAELDADPGAEADAAAGTSAAGTQPQAGLQQQTPPSQATFDSLAAQLSDITAAQQLILTRLDAMEQGGTVAAAEPDTAGAALDLGEATEEVRSLGVGIFWSLVIIVVFHFLIRALAWILETLAERSVRRRLTFKWLIPITRMALWGIAAYLILRTVFRVDAQGLLAASAALGLALGIAAQDLLKNVFGGLIVVFDQPFQVGDKISVGGTYGEVVSIGLRSTRIVTADDNLVTVPNSQVVEEQVANANAGQLNCQVVTDLYLPGRVDERKAREIAFEAAVTCRYVFLNKPIVVLVGDEFRTTFVTRVRVKAYVLDPRFEFLMQSDITERARDGFRAAGLMPEHDWYPMVEAPEATDSGESVAR
ncbi:MAG: mechanosensitive ion channel [Gammaproteobacteria bacterium]|nr:mechanosensitive ion channel [Gammaproteobacteria bacterium]MYC53124.1 mechanosensitive ion channel [Gammaproteobacteria bacterium]